MHPSVRHFMERLIDYAGLFPPAQLTVDAAIRHYKRYGEDQDSWMLGHFVVSASRLPELVPYMALFSEARPLKLSVVGNRSRSSEECLERLAKDMERIRTFRKQFRQAAVIDALELPLPPIPIPPVLLEAIGAESSRAGLRLCCETTHTRDSRWESGTLEAMDAIASVNSGSGTAVGVKIRTGGVTAEAFPAPHQVAFVLQACRDRKLPLKFTAGLHHPIRMYRHEASVKMHGFLNVFFAGMLAHAHGLDAGGIADIVGDENPDHFVFTDEGLRWRNLTMTAADIQSYRKTAFLAFGCCSFDEPREELRVLRLLEPRS
ncbi:hypothetical protein [Paenibacillus sp. R14(2021)]|uniref:hypothetical protein n=1 Tax=Paenibacillus sp. R14(2021) TaxID=2859228 RepID=UPI001C61217D|nr:hypothetical protein [Paenibacillus sp. R14(2021)]